MICKARLKKILKERTMLSSNRLSIPALIIALSICAGLGCFAATKPASSDTTIYKVRLKSSFGDAGTRKLSIDGKNYLWEVATAGMDLKIIKNTDGVFLIGRNHIGKYPAGSKHESPMSLFPGPIGDVKEFLKANSAKSLGKAEVDGKKCEMHEYTEKVSGWKCKLWTDAAKATPVKLELTGPNKGDSATATYLSYTLNEKIPASSFILPKNKKIRPMPDMKGEKKATPKKATPAK